ncbi:MAG: M15 family metallopeptidase [Oscillospiraceae bacterium]|jgi:D-alanyl-D-alanine carboxypeptidase|nr:M15 family metallopeptidase [Oscillospiraceae bacterium]
MPVKNTSAEHAAPKRRLRPSIKIAVAVVVAVLLGWMGLRLHHWIAQRGDTRVIVLVNPWNDVDNSGFSPKLKTVENIQVDKSCVEDLTEMLAACRAAGTPITLTAGYRSPEEQLSLFENEVSRQRAAGRDADTAYLLAEQRVGTPGTSEHQLGLAIDVQGTAAQEWMRENAWRYGFILRYPEGSESVTGRSADSSHYRYVGLTVAEQIQSLDICLEEYMGMFFTQDAEIVLDK